MSEQKCCCRINVWALGLALAIIWAAALFILALFSQGNGYGAEYIRVINSVYIGYHASFVGGIIGAFWGFIDAFIAGVIFGWLYNLLKGPCSCKKEEKE